jgi:hypothetical protein
MTVAPRYLPYHGALATGATVPLQLPPSQGACASHEDDTSAPQQPEAVQARRRRPRGRRRRAAAAAAAAAAQQAEQAAETDGAPRGEAAAAWQRELEARGAGGAGCGRWPRRAALFHMRQGGVDRVFVDHPLLRAENIYGGTGGGGGASLTYTEAGQFDDLDLRYSVLCQAALAAPVLLRQPGADGGAPRPGVVYVANDWPTALLLLRLRYMVRGGEGPDPRGAAGALPAAAAAAALGGPRQSHSPADFEELQALLARHLATAATAYCIHNLAYQGVYPLAAFPHLCLPPATLPPLLEPGGGAVNFMRGAIEACDEVVTVSPTYAEEVQREEGAGCGLRELIARRGITCVPLRLLSALAPRACL